MGAGLCHAGRTQSAEISIHEFTLEQLLGQGGFAAVYRTVWGGGGTAEPRRVALKVLSKHKVASPKHQLMVLQELKLLMSLRHPRMATLLCAFQDHESIYFGLECCPQGDLYGMLSRMPMARMTEEQVKFVACNVLLMFKYMHPRGVIHRDLKPGACRFLAEVRWAGAKSLSPSTENLLIDSRGYIKLTDFGISSHAPNGTCSSTSGTRCGCLAAM